MKELPPFAERLAPDTVVRLERAARERFLSGSALQEEGRRLAALYLFGYIAEICLSAAYLRRAGFPIHAAIDRDTRHRRMVQARQLRQTSGEPLMSSDPHPIVGWARFLLWQRNLSGKLKPAEVDLLNGAVNRAVIIYNYWRPELRYKIVEIAPKQLEAAQDAAAWLLARQSDL